KAFSSGVHPFKVAERAEERTVWLDGAKAAADAARVAEKASFMMNYYGRSEEIVIQWKSKPQGRKAHQRFSAMEEIRIVLLGFGSANRALVEMLCSKSELLGRQRSLRINRSGKSQLIPWRVVSIVTGRHGAVCIPTETDLIYEVNLQKALKVYESGRMLDDSLIVDQDGACILSKSDYRESAHHATGVQTIELLRTLAATNSANVVIEAIPSNPRNGEGEPAVSFIRAALLAGLHVVSANKGPLAQQLS
ncbi:hypothetical protein ACHAXN_008792, partial [Cyclotella atomus]